MAGRISRTRFALLGMLSLGPRSGYGLKKELESRISYFWNESVGQIYPTLRKLQQEGLVRSERQAQEGRPDRIVYRLTGEGRKTLRAWLAEPAATQPVRNELALKLFFASELDVEVARDHLEAFRQELRALRRVYAGKEDEIRRVARSRREETYWTLSLRLGQRLNAARLRWCDEALRALDELQASDAAPAAGRGRSR